MDEIFTENEKALFRSAQENIENFLIEIDKALNGDLKLDLTNKIIRNNNFKLGSNYLFMEVKDSQYFSLESLFNDFDDKSSLKYLNDYINEFNLFYLLPPNSNLFLSIKINKTFTMSIECMNNLTKENFNNTIIKLLKTGFKNSQTIYFKLNNNNFNLRITSFKSKETYEIKDLIKFISNDINLKNDISKKDKINRTLSLLNINENNDILTFIQKVKNKLEENDITGEFPEARCLYGKYVIIGDRLIFHKDVFKNKKLEIIYKILNENHEKEIEFFENYGIEISYKKCLEINDHLIENGLFDEINDIFNLKRKLDQKYPNYIIISQDIYDNFINMNL